MGFCYVGSSMTITTGFVDFISATQGIVCVRIAFPGQREKFVNGAGVCNNGC